MINFINPEAISMKCFNLSKFYVLNILSWSSWIIHLSFPIFLIYLFKIHPYTGFCSEDCSLDYLILPFLYFYYYYHLVLVLLILTIGECILRTFNIIKSYNQLNKYKKLTTFLFWTGLILIPLFALVLYKVAILLDLILFTD